MRNKLFLFVVILLFCTLNKLPFLYAESVSPCFEREYKGVGAHAFDRVGRRFYQYPTCESLQEQSYFLIITITGTGSGTITSAPIGISCGTDCSESYTADTMVTLTAVPDSNSVFTGWSGGGCSGTGPCTVTVSAATTVTATFNIKTFSITATTTAGGSITPLGVTTVTYGGGLTFTIAPDQFYHIADVRVDGASAGLVTTYLFANINSNHTIEAVFEKDPPSQVAQTIENIIASMPASVFNNPNNQNTLLNKMDAVISLINGGLYQDAIAKITNDLLKKADGCNNSGQPDKNDWITSCDSQGQLYSGVLYLVNQLQGM